MVCFTCNICGADYDVERFASEPATRLMLNPRGFPGIGPKIE